MTQDWRPSADVDALRLRAASPATTNEVFFDTLPDTLAPSASSRAPASPSRKTRPSS